MCVRSQLFAGSIWDESRRQVPKIADRSTGFFQYGRWLRPRHRRESERGPGLQIVDWLNFRNGLHGGALERGRGDDWS